MSDILKYKLLLFAKERYLTYMIILFTQLYLSARMCPVVCVGLVFMGAYRGEKSVSNSPSLELKVVRTDVCPLQELKVLLTTVTCSQSWNIFAQVYVLCLLMLIVSKHGLLKYRMQQNLCILSSQMSVQWKRTMIKAFLVLQ